MKPPLTRPKTAFTLIEVTIALGVAGFCLIAIFGLLPTALNSNQAAIEQTAANGVLTAVVADLRATARTSTPGSATTSAQFAIPIPANPVGTSTANAPLYFDIERQCSATLVADSRYRVTVTYLPNTGARSATLALVQAAWPAASTNSANTAQTFIALDRN